MRRYVFGIHAVRGNVTKPGSAKGKPQFATKPGSTKGKGPSSPLAWVNKRQGTIRHYLLSVHLRDAIFALQTFVFLQICVEVFRTCSKVWSFVSVNCLGVAYFSSMEKARDRGKREKWIDR